MSQRMREPNRLVDYSEIVCARTIKNTFLYPIFYNTLLNAFETRILLHIVMVKGKLFEARNWITYLNYYKKVK